MIRDAALAYAALGWHVVPVAPKGKNPCIGKGWQNKATTDEEQIVEWWKKHPEANVGVLLGPKSGIIDIECDSPEAEQQYAALFSGDPPVCPVYSGARGKHRLFQWRPDLPEMAIVKVGAIEIRLGNQKGAQSVFPPSVHPTGIQYVWLVHPDEVPPSAIPDAVMARIWNLEGEDEPDSDSPRKNGEGKPFEYWAKIIDGVSEGERTLSMASYVGKLLRSVTDIEDEESVKIIFTTAQAVNAKNAPPLPDKELKRVFLSILGKEKKRRVAEDVGCSASKPLEGQPAYAASFQLFNREQSEPTTWELYHPSFDRSRHGTCRIVLSTEQLLSAKHINIQATEQARVVFDPTKINAKSWPKILRILVGNATPLPADREENRTVTVAKILLLKLSENPLLLKESQNPEPTRICKTVDGDYIFDFDRMFGDLNYTAHRVTHKELVEVLKKAGAAWWRQGRNSKRLKLITKSAVLKLEELTEG